jgi:hypothetical protein
MLEGANGALRKVLLSFIALNGPNPQSELYLNFIESPIVAAALEVNFKRIILPVKLPESNVAVAPKAPVGIVHCHPVATPFVALAAGSAGAM